MEQSATAGTQVERLSRNHDTSDFTCGVEALDRFLQRHAQQGMDQGLSNTLVVVAEGRVIAYATLGVGTLQPEEASARLSKGMPAYPQPMLVLQRLAVDQAHQGQGLAALLVLHAAAMACRMADAARLPGQTKAVPVRGLMIHAKNEAAKAFYARFDITEESPVDPYLLMVLVKDLRKALGL